MRYDEWQAGIPDEIKGDFLWKLEVYRLGLFIAEILWHDALELNKHSLTRSTADQLFRAVCSISINIAEGYTRSTAKIALAFWNIHLVLPVKHAIGITNLDIH